MNAIQREAQAFQRRNPAARPKWSQYRTEEQQRIVANAALTRRNLRAQARKLGFKGPDAIERMLDSWLPDALEVMSRVDTPEAQAIGMVLERIAVALEKMAGASLPAAQPAAAGNGAWTCPVHGVTRVVPAGVSKKTGKEYSAFVVCGLPGCDERPFARTRVVASEASVATASVASELP